MGLQASDPDVVAFNLAIRDKYLDLQELYHRINGSPLLVPASLDRDFFRWRTLAVRHKQGDLRHSEDEVKAMQAIASWTLDVQCMLIPHKKREKMPWET